MRLRARWFWTWNILQGASLAKGLAVVVLGGRQVACERAEFLAKRGNRVTLVFRLPQLWIWRATWW